MSRSFVVAFVVLLAFATAWFVWASPTLDAPPVAPEPGVPPAAAAEAPAPALADGAATAPESAVPAVAATTDPARVVIADAATQAKLRVRVVDADQQPIENATIETFADSTPGITRTDRDGRATLPGPIRGDARRLLVRAGDRHAQALWQFRSDLEITLKWFGPVRGRVVDRATGTAIPGVTVMRPHHNCKHCELDRVVADANGAFELAAVPRDEDCVFAFSADGYARQFERLRIPGKGEPLVHTFSLQRGVVVTGRCVDLATRQSLGGVRVIVQGATPTETAADGAFRILVLPTNEGTVSLQFEHRDHCRVTNVVATPQLDPALEFALPRAVSLTGRVTTPAGAPIAGARVRPAGNENLTDLPGMLPGSRVSAVSDDVSATSDASGAFVLPRLAPGGQYHVYATHDDFAPPSGQRGMAVAECKADAPPVVIVLERKPTTDGFGAIVGTFRCNGEPRGGQLDWHWRSLRGSCPIRRDGSFHCEKVPAGKVNVSAAPESVASSGWPPDGVIWHGTVDVIANNDAALDIVHEFAEGTIRGRVTFVDGSPAARRAVSGQHERIHTFARTGDDGCYVLRIPQTSAEVTVRCDRDTRTARLGAIGVDFVVPRNVMLRIRARDDAGARLGVHYSVRPGGESHLMLQEAPTPDPEGFVTIESAEGPCSVLLAASGCVASLHSLDVRAGGKNELDVVLPRGVAVTLRLHRDAAPPAAWSVQVVDPVFADMSTQSNRMLRLQDKRHVMLTHAGTTLAGFGPGTHKLVCNDHSIELEPRTFEVGSAPVTVDVKWRQRAK
jgi:hypothetical protein